MLQQGIHREVANIMPRIIRAACQAWDLWECPLYREKVCAVGTDGLNRFAAMVALSVPGPPFDAQALPAGALAQAENITGLVVQEVGKELGFKTHGQHLGVHLGAWGQLAQELFGNIVGVLTKGFKGINEQVGR